MILNDLLLWWYSKKSRFGPLLTVTTMTASRSHLSHDSSSSLFLYDYFHHYMVLKVILGRLNCWPWMSSNLALIPLALLLFFNTWNNFAVRTAWKKLPLKHLIFSRDHYICKSAISSFYSQGDFGFKKRVCDGGFRHNDWMKCCEDRMFESSVSENYGLCFYKLVLCSEMRKAKNLIQMVQTKHNFWPQEKHDDIILSQI